MVANTMTFIYDTYAYLYNARSELTNAVKNVTLNEYAYQYDDIGNREFSSERGTNRTYTANVLNQYTQITSLAASASLREEFIQQFDADGNQTLIQTATGVWSVTYNGENRPVSWTCGATNLTMRFDSMGRRAEYLETTANEDLIITNKHQYFVYDGYLCLQIVNAQTGVAEYAFEWDPTEPVATRPMVMQRTGNYHLFYTHDGNKNVSELVYYQRARGVAAHYEYAPFGAVTAQTRGNGWGTLDFAALNPFRFSSEFADDTLGLVYYNYRHYDPVTGRWMSRDEIEELGACGLYLFCDNDAVSAYDQLGLFAEHAIKSIADFSETRAGKFITCMGDCIEDNDPEEFLINALVDKISLESLIVKLELETVKGAVGYSGIPKTFIAWYYKMKGDEKRADIIMSQLKLIAEGKSKKSPLALKPLKAMLKDVKGGAFRAKITKAAKIHPYYTIAYGSYLLAVESYCAIYCANNCDYDPATPSIKKGLESVTSAMEKFRESAEDVFR